MNSIQVTNILRFIILVLAQILICNNINFLGYINPYIYVLFILLYPINNNRMLFLFWSFLIGLIIDMFSDSGGINAAACVTIAFVRPAILKFCFGAVYEHQTVKFSDIDFVQRLTYFTLMVGIHHIVLFTLEIFNFSYILLILKKTLFSGIFTIVLSLLLATIFSRNSK